MHSSDVAERRVATSYSKGATLANIVTTLDTNYSIVAERLLLFKVDEVQNNTTHYIK